MEAASDGHGDEFYLLLASKDPKRPLDRAELDRALSDLAEEVRDLEETAEYTRHFTFTAESARRLLIPDEAKFAALDRKERDDIEETVKRVTGFTLPPTFSASAVLLTEGIRRAQEETAADRRIDETQPYYRNLMNAIGGCLKEADTRCTEAKTRMKEAWKEGKEANGGASDRAERNKLLAMVLERGINAKLQEGQLKRVTEQVRHQAFVWATAIHDN